MIFPPFVISLSVRFFLRPESKADGQPFLVRPQLFTLKDIEKLYFPELWTTRTPRISSFPLFERERLFPRSSLNPFVPGNCFGNSLNSTPLPIVSAINSLHEYRQKQVLFTIESTPREGLTVPASRIRPSHLWRRTGPPARIARCIATAASPEVRSRLAERSFHKALSDNKKSEGGPLPFQPILPAGDR